MREWRGVGLVSGWQVSASVCFYAVFATTAFLRADFGLTRFRTGLAVTAVIAGYTLSLFAAGAIVDAYGERLPMVSGLLAMGIGCVAVAVVPSYPLVLASLVLLGLAYATAMPATNRAVLVVAPEGRRNLAMNVKQVGVTVGSGLSAGLITVAGAGGDWERGFLVAAAIAVVVALAFARDYEGRVGSGDLSLPDVRGLLSGAGYRGLLVAGFFLGAAVFTTTGYVVLHMTDTVLASAAVAGGTLAAVQVTGSLGRLGGGAVADRLALPASVANARVLLVQAVVSVVGFIGVTLVGTPPVAAAAFALLGFFVLGFPGMYYGCLTALVDDDEVGAATAGGQTAINLGGLVAPPAFGYLADTAGYALGWYALAGCAALAAVALVPLVRE
ncbi:MFS transporter [Halobaculum gomorrense]|uniref:Predicted arabinose efflux permease, MFS family n=1 Tax=Halobaculum gomorrense TaxID=43928 RepID=A0A1M5U7U7_9EURY|nr:MFS transporter [Halobaculum gomorrense]SHH58763.1 Predicted arabinose efflux permease, MFS family [Halobaculum gomorrense]